MGNRKVTSWIAFGVIVLIIIAELALVQYFFFSARWGTFFLGCTSTCKTPPDLFLIFLGSGIITFLSTVLAQKQDERLKNSSFGALASGVITLIITFIKKDGTPQEYLLYAFLGSGLGAFNGWLVYACIALRSYFKYDSIVPFMELVAHGLDSMSDRIVSDENGQSTEKLKYYLERLSNELSTRISSMDNLPALDQKNRQKHSHEVLLILYNQRREFLESITRYILTSIVELFNLVYGSMRFRASVIKFDFAADSTPQNKKYTEGRHWIYYYGFAPPFLKDDPFLNDSAAYKLLTDGKGKSVEYIKDPSQGQVSNRMSDERYEAFSLFRISDQCVLTLDWAFKQGKKIDDSIIETIQDLLLDSLVLVLASVTGRILEIDVQIKLLTPTLEL